MHRASRAHFLRGANSLPSYLVGAVVKRIYRSLLANVARKRRGCSWGLIKIMWAEGRYGGEKRRRRRVHEGIRCGRDWYRVRRVLVASASLHLEKLVEGAARRARESIMDRTRMRKKKEEREGEPSRESTSPRNRSRDSEAPMHIIGRPCRLIRLTLQFRCQRNIISARDIYFNRDAKKILRAAKMLRTIFCKRIRIAELWM